MPEKKKTENSPYQLIASAIDYIQDHYKEHPSLEEIADTVGLSTFHFQRLVTTWAGISSKKFIQYLSPEYAKNTLKHQQCSALDTTYIAGLSSSSRLHDLFISIQSMSSGEYENGGEKLSISFFYSKTPFGQVIAAFTDKGICHLAFEENQNKALSDLKSHFPNAKYHHNHSRSSLHHSILSIFEQNWNKIDPIKLHIKGSAFQLKVWSALLKLPTASLSSYEGIAKSIHQPKASRAVGSAIGRNPVAFLIPCHRVINKNGHIGSYMWGSTRKTAIIGWEASTVDRAKSEKSHPIY